MCVYIFMYTWKQREIYIYIYLYLFAFHTYVYIERVCYRTSCKSLGCARLARALALRDACVRLARKQYQL